MTRKSKPHAKHGGGSYVALSRFALQSQSFAKLSPHAVKLLLDFMAGYSGFSNGDLSMPWSHAVTRGWRSRDTLNRALKELLDGGWIIKTRQGGRRNRTCCLYAITLFSIDDCRHKTGVSKFDAGITPTERPPGGWYRDPPTAVVKMSNAPRGNGN
jgi:hypothetical protein